MLHPLELEIRHFSPLEFYRLQSFTDQDFYKASEVIPDSQLYKTAGNSINVIVLEALFKNLLLGGGNY